MKAIKLLQELKDLKLRRWGKDEYTKALNSSGEGGGTIDDPVMRIMSLVREGNYDYAEKGSHYSQEGWEDFVRNLPDEGEIVGQYSEDTSNVVYFVFPGESESEDDYYTIVFLLSDDDYALVPAVIESEGEEDSASYLDDWANNVTEGEYASISEIPEVTSVGYYEGWSLAPTNGFQAQSSNGLFMLKDRNHNIALAFNATWEVSIISK